MLHILQIAQWLIFEENAEMMKILDGFFLQTHGKFILDIPSI